MPGYDLRHRFSIAHFDKWAYPSAYYELMKGSSRQFKNEIFDIYFGKIFRYEYKGQEIYDDSAKTHRIAYGNVMGVEASDKQVDHLFRIQEELGIKISLTINQLNVPIEIFYSKNDRTLGEFLDWLQGYYDRGLRSCTLANNHMMRAGFLQNRFPEMTWKNTVNQQVSTAQQVIDYLYLGYNVIQLDRSLNRNMDELKRIKEVIEAYKDEHKERSVKTCMLVLEDCMPSCPFKRAHDDLQIYHKNIDYWKTQPGKLSCNRWRNIFKKAGVPRAGTNCCWLGVDTFKEYADLVDIFKFSGRLVEAGPVDFGRYQVGWFTENSAVRSFSEIIGNRLEPVNAWSPGYGVYASYKTEIDDIREDLKDNYPVTGESKKLENRLKNCKNQCYACHLCERTFGLPDFDSLIEL